jgi:rhodanese-related sulfurtransferase
VLLIDVRRPDEISANGGFPVYLSIQIGELEKHLDAIPKDRIIVTVSNHAARGGKAADLLASHGFNVAGAVGAETYEKEGGTLTKIEPPKKAGEAENKFRIQEVRIQKSEFRIRGIRGMKTHHLLLIAGLSVLACGAGVCSSRVRGGVRRQAIHHAQGIAHRVDWINPHAWLHVDVKDASGKVVNWSVEFGSPNALLRRGLRKTDFPPGTEVVIEGYRAKNGTATLNGRSVKLPDGRNLFTGGSAPDEQPQQ